jgi:hypothetical protein
VYPTQLFIEQLRLVRVFGNKLQFPPVVDITLTLLGIANYVNFAMGVSADVCCSLQHSEGSPEVFHEALLRRTYFPFCSKKVVVARSILLSL